jgi:hypothetical protein
MKRARRFRAGPSTKLWHPGERIDQALAVEQRHCPPRVPQTAARSRLGLRGGETRRGRTSNVVGRFDYQVVPMNWKFSLSLPGLSGTSLGLVARRRDRVSKQTGLAIWQVDAGASHRACGARK